MQGNSAQCSFFRKLPDLTSVATGSPRVAKWVLILTGIALFSWPGVPACSAQAPDLTSKSLEDLMSIQVTSVSKKEQTTSQAAAAIFVISR